ncbi:MAG: hypothetical protein WKF84_16285 [Pyrinomonadaceae bacterium]
MALPEESVADVLVSDRPLEIGDPDPLNFRRYRARHLAIPA